MNTVCHATYCLMRLSYFVSWQYSLCGVDIGLLENEGSIKADIELFERIPIKLVAVFTSLYKSLQFCNVHIQERRPLDGYIDAVECCSCTR